MRGGGVDCPNHSIRLRSCLEKQSSMLFLCGAHEECAFEIAFLKLAATLPKKRCEFQESSLCVRSASQFCFYGTKGWWWRHCPTHSNFDLVGISKEKGHHPRRWLLHQVCFRIRRRIIITMEIFQLKILLFQCPHCLHSFGVVRVVKTQAAQALSVFPLLSYFVGAPQWWLRL